MKESRKEDLIATTTQLIIDTIILIIWTLTFSYLVYLIIPTINLPILKSLDFRDVLGIMIVLYIVKAFLGIKRGND